MVMEVERVLCCCLLIIACNDVQSRHFNGGTIRWVPVDPYANDSSITITLIQSYFWTFPGIMCANNVPISTAGRSGEVSNLTCIADCSMDGGYSAKPVNTLTDCVSANAGVGVLTSTRATNITLAANAHFYASNAGTAWRTLNLPARSGLEWSILFKVDLRRRPDGFINTPPVASIVSPQYVIVNQTTDIRIITSDENPSDDVRCRWSTYTSGYRRKKRSEVYDFDKGERTNVATLTRRKRGTLTCSANDCLSQCSKDCPCNCATCASTTCTGPECNDDPCRPLNTTVKTTTTSTTVSSTTVLMNTTIDTPGTLRSTSSYPIRQAIDECADICYPGSLPNNTTLSNCTVSFRGLVPNTWYALAVQIEDFINQTSNDPMSSVPLQILIYVMPTPKCSIAPVILPINDCPEVVVGLPRQFNLTIMNGCTSFGVPIKEILLSRTIAGLLGGNLTNSSVNASMSYATFTWTPQMNQIGFQQACFIAYTSELLQSAEYCVTFEVKTAVYSCSTSSTSTSSTTASTITTSTTASTSTSTTTTTRTTSTTTSTATTTTTSTTSVTTPTFSLTTSIAIDNTPSKTPSWGLIAGLSSLILPLGLCSACCLYRLLWSPAARRRRSEQEKDDDDDDDEEKQRPIPQSYSLINSETNTRTTSSASSRDTSKASCSIETPSKTYRVYNVESTEWQVESQASMISVSSGSILQREYLRKWCGGGGGGGEVK